MTTVDIRQQFLRGDSSKISTTECYLTYQSVAKIETYPLGSQATGGERFSEQVVNRLIQADLEGQVALPIISPEAIQLVVGQQGALCLTLGLTDYTSLTASQRDLGNIVYQYHQSDGEYVTIIHRKIASQLKGVAEQMYQANFSSLPKAVQLRVTSKPESKTTLTNRIPSQESQVKYHNLSDVTAVCHAVQLQAISLGTQIPMESYHQISELEAELQQTVGPGYQVKVKSETDSDEVVE